MSLLPSHAAKAPMPPSTSREDFFDVATHEALLQWTLANQERFFPATVLRPAHVPADRCPGGEIQRAATRDEIAIEHQHAA